MSELLKINVNDHTEKKNGLTYLSWAWAWAEVLKHDSTAVWKLESFGDSILCQMPDGTAFVSVTVTIKGLARNCFLPVMDHRNKAIPKPNAFDVNKAIMRCLAKAIAMHGLGLYIYAGEDLPETDDSLVPALTASIEQAKARKGVMGAVLGGMPQADPAESEYIADLAENVKDLFAAKGVATAFERIEADGLDSDQKLRLWNLLPSNIRSGLKKEGESRRVTA